MIKLNYKEMSHHELINVIRDCQIELRQRGISTRAYNVYAKAGYRTTLLEYNNPVVLKMQLGSINKVKS